MQQVKFWRDITQKRGTKDKSLPTYGTVVTFISEHIHWSLLKSGFRMLQNPKKEAGRFCHLSLGTKTNRWIMEVKQGIASNYANHRSGGR
jgi:hypothetical protein